MNEVIFTPQVSRFLNGFSKPNEIQRKVLANKGKKLLMFVPIMEDNLFHVWSKGLRKLGSCITDCALDSNFFLENTTYYSHGRVTANIFFCSHSLYTFSFYAVR